MKFFENVDRNFKKGDWWRQGIYYISSCYSEEKTKNGTHSQAR